MKFLKNTLLALSFVMHGALYAQETNFIHIASCTGALNDRTSVTLDFFEEFDDSSTMNRGYVVQTMGLLPGENIKMMEKITLTGYKQMEKITLTGYKQKIITMYALLNPPVPFASFVIDLEKKTDVEIFSPGFGAVWGKFSCKPSPLGELFNNSNF